MAQAGTKLFLYSLQRRVSVKQALVKYWQSRQQAPRIGLTISRGKPMKMLAQHFRHLFTLGGILLLGGCASGIQVTHHPLAAESNLPGMHTYCWAIGKAEDAMECLAPAAGHNKFFDPTVRASINEALEAKGYIPGDCATADFMIDYRMGIHEDVAAVDVSAEDPLHDYGARWSFGKQADIHYEGLTQPEETLITVQHGALHIAAFTPAGELLWHSESHKVLSERETDSNRLKTIRKASDGAMKYFPERK
jgi:hypothetical protein